MVITSQMPLQRLSQDCKWEKKSEPSELSEGLLCGRPGSIRSDARSNGIGRLPPDWTASAVRRPSGGRLARATLDWTAWMRRTCPIRRLGLAAAVRSGCSFRAPNA